ncbi:MAG: type II toxin-antitoxin system Phd/YefM family antitoxin [Candidatus Bipolaricaulota bacterium]
MTTINTHEAKTQLSRLLARVEAGEEFIIARAGTPVARLVPIETHIGTRQSGTAAGCIRVAADFDDPLPDELVSSFEQ